MVANKCIVRCIIRGTRWCFVCHYMHATDMLAGLMLRWYLRLIWCCLVTIVGVRKLDMCFFNENGATCNSLDPGPPSLIWSRMQLPPSANLGLELTRVYTTVPRICCSLCVQSANQSNFSRVNVIFGAIWSARSPLPRAEGNLHRDQSLKPRSCTTSSITVRYVVAAK